MIIQDFHGNFLSVVNGHLVSTRKKSDLGVMISGKNFIFYDKNQFENFSVCEGGRSVCGHAFAASINENGSISFLHLETGKILSGVPCEENHDYQVCGLRDEKYDWEIFSIHLESDAENIEDVIEERFFCNPDSITVAEITKITESKLSDRKKKILLSALLAAFELDFQKPLCECIEKIDVFSKIIIDLLVDNEEIKKSLIELMLWMRLGRGEEYYYDISGKFLGFDKTSHSGYELNTEETLLHCLRRNISPIKKSCIVTTIKNEGVYILDWIAHHKAMGFEKIFIYSNDNTDNSDNLLKILSDKKIITWLKSTAAPGANAQGQSYSHALMFNKEILNYEWSAFVDMDEFFCVNKSKFFNINEFLLWHSQSREDCICINWCFVSPSNQSRFRQDPIFSRFDVYGGIDQHIKSCFRPHFFHGSHPHYPISSSIYNPIFVESDKSAHTSLLGPIRGEKAFSDFPTGSDAIVYHYFLKSAEEFVWKFSRNRGDYPNVVDDIYINIEDMDSFSSHFFQEYKQTHSNETGKFMLASREESIKEREKLLEDADILHAYNLILSSYKERMEKLLQLCKTYEGKYENCSRLLNIIEND